MNEYTLDTPFVITSGVTHINTEDLSSDHSYIDGITFNYDGTKMYTTLHEIMIINQYKLTTTYDVSTLSLEGY